MYPSRAIAEALGIQLGDVVAVDGGQGRTAFAQMGGEAVVVKWSGDPSWGESLERAVTISATLQARGYPTADTIAYGAVEGLGWAWVQQRLAGNPIGGVPSDAMLDEILAAVELQAGADDSNNWSWLEAVVWDDAAGWWGPARARDPEARRLVDEVETWVQETGRAVRRSDYVHHDLNSGNILVADGHLSGICDLDHVGHGDRALDLAALAFSIARWPDSAVIVQRLVREGRRITGEAGWRQAVCYLIVSRYGWVGEFGMQVALDDALRSARAVFEYSRTPGSP